MRDLRGGQAPAVFAALMLVPLEGEVAWILPSGPHPYWRGRVTRLAYEFAP